MKYSNHYKVLYNFIVIFLVPAIRTISCEERFYSSSGSTRFSRELSTATVQLVRCPKNCNRDNYNIRLYGTGVYTDFSYICYAAIHDGKITSKMSEW